MKTENKTDLIKQRDEYLKAKRIAQRMKDCDFNFHLYPFRFENTELNEGLDKLRMKYGLVDPDLVDFKLMAVWEYIDRQRRYGNPTELEALRKKAQKVFTYIDPYYLDPNVEEFPEIPNYYLKELDTFIDYCSQKWLQYQHKLAEQFDLESVDKLPKYLKTRIKADYDNGNLLGYSVYAGRVMNLTDYKQETEQIKTDIPFTRVKSYRSIMYNAGICI